jgi:hypothetical protein
MGPQIKSIPLIPHWGYDSWFYPLCILIIHPFYPHIHMISPGFVWKFGTPIFFQGESLSTPRDAILGPFGAPKGGAGTSPCILYSNMAGKSPGPVDELPSSKPLAWGFSRPWLSTKGYPHYIPISPLYPYKS